MEIKLGQTVKETITGFTGVVTSVMEQLNGNIQVGVQPKTKDEGSMPDALYIDHHTLEVVDDAFVSKAGKTQVTDIKVGQRVRDTATGMTGIAVSKSTYLNGCVFFLVMPPFKADTLVPENPRGDWISCTRLEVVGDGISESAKPASTTRSGGPSSRTPAQRAHRPA